MIFKYKSEISIKDKKEMYNLFKPNVFANESIILSNENSKLNKVIKNNNNVLDLVKRFDLMEV